MSGLSRLSIFRPDPFTLGIVGAVALASALPARGQTAEALGTLVKVAITAMFFLYGARLKRELVISNLTNWRLHVAITLISFVLFPLVALTSGVLVPHVLSPDLYVGIVFLSALPSTLQASIVFTSIARGNVAGAVCSASLSNLLGVVLTPLLVMLLLNRSGAGMSLHAIEAIALQLLVPFIAGQLSRPFIGGWADRHKALLTFIDRISILLLVYSAFSEAVAGALWQRLGAADIAAAVSVDVVLLIFVLLATRMIARRIGFSRADEIAIVFCGSKKSMVCGLPMANVLFAGGAIGVIVIPLMMFHQLQLIACAMLARRYAGEPPIVDDEARLGVTGSQPA